MSTTAEYVAGEYDLTEWNFNIDYSVLDEQVSRAVANALETTFNGDFAPEISVPYTWSFSVTSTDGFFGPRVSDPLTLYLILPLSDHLPHFRFDLRDVFFDAVASEREVDMDEEDTRQMLRSYYSTCALELRKLADKLDAEAASIPI